MPPEEAAPNSDALQFDRALTPSSSYDGSAVAAVTCANCGAGITTEYFHVAGQTVCAACRDLVQASVATPRGWGAFLKSMAFGVGAAIAGAAIYYAVIAIANVEIGIVAILIGYMVGYMVRKGAGGKGGRRFQILALILTYWSVGLAYSPLAFKAVEEKAAKKSAVSVDSSHAARSDSANTSSARTDSSLTNAPATGRTGAKASTAPVSGRAFLLGIGVILLLTFALPVVFVIGSLPSGLLSALIILIGLRQAWRMTAAPAISVSGPYKVGPHSSASPA